MRRLLVRVARSLAAMVSAKSMELIEARAEAISWLMSALCGYRLAAVAVLLARESSIRDESV